MEPSTIMELKRGVEARFGHLDAQTLQTLATISPVYRRNTRKTLAAMEEAVNRQDPAQLRMAAHTLFGTSANLGFYTLSVLCEQLELLAEAGAANYAWQKIGQIEAEFAQVERALAELVEQAVCEGRAPEAAGAQMTPSW